VTGAHLVDGAHLTLDGGSISGGGANCRTSAVGADLQENSRLVAKNAATFKDVAGNALRLNETSRATLTNASIDRDFSGLNLCATLPSIASFAASG
jgi:hypothetical protein